MTTTVDIKLAPICLFVYNRPGHTLSTLQSLQQCRLADQSILYIYADGIKHHAAVENIQKIEEVRKIIRQEPWCKEVHIIESEKNKGLANSIITGVGEVLNKHGKAIIVEDDLHLSPAFLEYMNQALHFYEDDEKVMHIAAFTPPVKAAFPETFFFPVPTCWGWATWARAWQHFNPDAADLLPKVLQKGQRKFDFNFSINYVRMLQRNINRKVDSWFIRWYASIYLLDGLCLHPAKSLVRNTGLDHSGINSYKSSVFDTAVAESIQIKEIPHHFPVKVIKAYIRFNLKVKLRHIPEYAWRVITRNTDT